LNGLEGAGIYIEKCENRFADMEKRLGCGTGWCGDAGQQVFFAGK